MVVEIEIVTTEASFASTFFKAFDNGHQRVAGDVEGAEEVALGCFVKRFWFAGVVGKGDRVEEAIDVFAVIGDLAGEPFDLVFVLDIAHEHFRIADELLDLLAAGFAADGVDDFGAGFDQHTTGVPGDALFVGDAHHEDAFAGELEEVGGHFNQDLTTEAQRTRRRIRATGTLIFANVANQLTTNFFFSFH